MGFEKRKRTSETVSWIETMHMDITILGSGGNRTTPWPTCTCNVCSLARQKGGKHVRYGNSTFIHDEAILIDVPEHIFYQLNKNVITSVKHIFISHWHPDHCAGLRVVQSAVKGSGEIVHHDDLKLHMTETTYNNIVSRILPGLAV